MNRSRNRKRVSASQRKDRQKLFCNSFATETSLTRPFPSQENIDGFSSSDSDGESARKRTITKKRSLEANSKTKTEVKETRERNFSDYDDEESEKIAWSNSSREENESGKDDEEEEDDDIGDTSFSQSNLKKRLNVSIREYKSDEDVPKENEKPVAKNRIIEDLSQEAIEEPYSSPVQSKQTSLILTDKTEISLKGIVSVDVSFNQEYNSDEDETSNKRKKVVKGGLAEQLQKLISHEKSEIAFWKHTKNKFSKERTIMVRVVSTGVAYSTLSIKCSLTHAVNLHIMLPKDHLKDNHVKAGTMLRIYPPWKRMICEDLNSLVILCAYHIEVLPGQTPFIQTVASHDLISFHQKLLMKIFDNPDEISFTNDLMSTLETTNLKAPLTDAKHYTIVEAVEKNGYAKYMSFCGRIQRVFCRVVKSLSADKYSFAEKIAQSQESEAMEERYGVLVQDNDGAFCEITIPSSLVWNKGNWKHIVTNGEGKLCTFKNFRLVKRRVHNRCSSLSSMVQSLQSNPETIKGESQRADSIEDGSTQNSFQPLVNSSYLFAVDENTSKIDFENVPTEYNISFQPCIKYAFHMDTTPNGRYLVYMKILTVTSIGEDGSFADIFGDQCFVYGSCVFKHCSQVHKVKKLPSCYVPISVVERFEAGGKDIMICFKDLFIYNGQLIADPYTRIFLLQENKSNNIFTMIYDSSILNDIQQPSLPCMISTSVEEGDLVIVQGIICGVDEETALFWNVCSDCKSDDLLESDKKNIWCESCGKETTSELNMQLDIFLFISSMPTACILCKLQKSTISNLLPKPTEGQFEGYDMKNILNKKFGPSLCHVVDVVLESKQIIEDKIFLKDVTPYAEYRIME